MALVLRPVGYTGGLQQLTWPYDTTTAYAWLWGGAGGGGGGDGGRVGGNGTGGGFSYWSFGVNPGDTITVAVGGGGGGGLGNSGSAQGGSAGASLVLDSVWNTTQLLGGSIIRSQNGAYCTFLNTYGVWINPVSATYFNETVTVNFPITGPYTFTASCDNYGTIYLDGQVVVNIGGFGTTYSARRAVTAGLHTITLSGVNTGGPGSIALTVDGGGGYSGGVGGRAGPYGSSGGGGGSGGATLVMVNDSILAIAGGGGGGGGAGVSGFTPGYGSSAPGPWGTNPATTSGQNGGNHPSDGGGGGAGGGGAIGGNAGYWGGATPSNPNVANDVAGTGGSFGLGFGLTTEDPSGTNAGGRTNEYYAGGSRGGSGSVSTGSAGGTGYAVIGFDINGVFVHDAGQYQSVRSTYINNNGIWKQVKTIWVKDGGAWQQVLGGAAPNFGPITGGFGIAPNAGPFYIEPAPPPMGDGGMGDGVGDGMGDGMGDGGDGGGE